MNAEHGEGKVGYDPGSFDVPPLFRSTPQPLQMIKWFLFKFMWYQSVLWILISFICYRYFTPDLSNFQSFRTTPFVMIWLRNISVMFLVVGAQHWYLYTRKSQGTDFKYDSRWLAKRRRSFTFDNQTKDNMFWSLFSGCGIAALYEVFMFYLHANASIGRIDSFLPTALTTVSLFWLSSIHFYANHRLLHIKLLYETVHFVHHRNVNTGPWSGISMHPFEHLVYFSLPLAFIFIPASPFLVTFSLLYLILAPSPSHSGFHRYRLGSKDIPAADYFHYLHHKYFDCNYGTILFPLDKWFDTFHDGSAKAHEEIIEKRTSSRKQL